MHVNPLRAKIEGRVPARKAIMHSAFGLVDNFRTWARSVKMDSAIIEKHVQASKGRGHDAQFAYFNVIQKEYEKKDREHV